MFSHLFLEAVRYFRVSLLPSLVKIWCPSSWRKESTLKYWTPGTCFGGAGFCHGLGMQLMGCCSPWCPPITVVLVRAHQRGGSWADETCHTSVHSDGLSAGPSAPTWSTEEITQSYHQCVPTMPTISQLSVTHLHFP